MTGEAKTGARIRPIGGSGIVNAGAGGEKVRAAGGKGFAMLGHTGSHGRSQVARVPGGGITDTYNRVVADGWGRTTGNIDAAWLPWSGYETLSVDGVGHLGVDLHTVTQYGSTYHPGGGLRLLVSEEQDATRDIYFEWCAPTGLQPFDVVYPQEGQFFGIGIEGDSIVGGTLYIGWWFGSPGQLEVYATGGSYPPQTDWDGEADVWYSVRIHAETPEDTGLPSVVKVNTWVKGEAEPDWLVTFSQYDQYDRPLRWTWTRNIDFILKYLTDNPQLMDANEVLIENLNVTGSGDWTVTY